MNEPIFMLAQVCFEQTALRTVSNIEWIKWRKFTSIISDFYYGNSCRWVCHLNILSENDPRFSCKLDVVREHNDSNVPLLRFRLVQSVPEVSLWKYLCLGTMSDILGLFSCNQRELFQHCLIQRPDPEYFAKVFSWNSIKYGFQTNYRRVIYAVAVEDYLLSIASSVLIRP